MSSEEVPSNEAAPVVATDIDTSLARELGGDLGSYSEEEMEDVGSEASSGLSEVESKESVEKQWEGKDNGRPDFKCAVSGVGKEQSTQEFFQQGNGNASHNDDDIFATPGRQTMMGALARLLSAVAPSSPQQVGTALTLNSAEGSSKGVGTTGSKGVEGRDVAVDEWVEEVVKESEDKMEGMAGLDRSAAPSPTPARWGSMMPVSPAGRTRPTPVPVTPTRGSKRMAMGTPRPIRHYQPMALPGSTAGLVLKQILAAVARVERKMEEKARKVEEAVEAAVARWDARLVEGLSAVLGVVGEREERLVARLLADAVEREKRLAVKLLALDAVETEKVQKAKWDLKQVEDLAVLMRSGRQELREVKRTVEEIAAGMVGARVAHPAHEPMEGVVATPAPRTAEGGGAMALATTREPPIVDNMEGIEREGLFASQHTPELDTPSSTQSPALMEKKKDKGKTKALLIVEPSSATAKRKPKGSPRQLQRQAAVNEAKAKAAVPTSTPGAGPSAPTPPRLILKRPEAVAAEMKAAEKREEEKLKVEERKEEKRKAVERREAEKLAKKAVAKSRWDAVDPTEQEWKAYGEAANPIKALLVSDEEGEKAAQRIAHLADMRAVEELWEDRQARAEKLPTPRVGPPQQQECQQPARRQPQGALTGVSRQAQ